MRFSNREVAAMNKLYKSGISIKDIANSFDCDQSTVGYHVNGVTKLRKKGRYLKKKINSLSDAGAYIFAEYYCNIPSGVSAR